MKNPRPKSGEQAAGPARSAARAAGALSAAALASAADCRQVHAAGSDVLRIGLIGCGGRGTGAASQALKADSAVKLVAMGDLFADRLESSLSNLQAEADIAAKLDVPPKRQFVGWDAYKKVIGSDVDVVLLASPPHFRPMHLEAAVAANKHVFAEKPVAVDAPGIRRVLAACEQAKQRGARWSRACVCATRSAFARRFKRFTTARSAR